MQDLQPHDSRRKASSIVLLTALALSLFAQSLWAQSTRHYLFDIRTPAGQIGRSRAAQRPELMGYFQPVAVRVPESATIAVAEAGAFGVHDLGSTLVGLQVGEVYRLQLDNIPNSAGRLYPTVELIDRMHPPAGKETRYPIPIEIAPEDIALALAGKYVTRVIYVEDPLNALPVRDVPTQRYFEVMAHEDPLHVADELGRPVAILRMGTLAPGPNGPSAEFLFGSPALQRYAIPAERPYVPSELRPGDLPVEVERQKPSAPAPKPAQPDEATTPSEVPPLAVDDAPTEQSSPSDTDNIFDEPLPAAPSDTPSDTDDANPFDDI